MVDEVDELLSKHGADIQVLWDYAHLGHSLGDPRRSLPVDLILVPGGYDTRPAAHAAEIFASLMRRQEKLPLVVPTGFASPIALEQWGMTEAAACATVFAQRLESLVGARLASRADVLLEGEASNLGANAKFVRRLVDYMGKTPTHVLGVCKPYLERRTFATLLLQGPGEGCMITMQSPPVGLGDWLRGLHHRPGGTLTPTRSVKTLVGDFDRVAFPMGFLAQQPVSEKAWNAYVRLNDAGFSRPRAEEHGHELPPGLVRKTTQVGAASAQSPRYFSTDMQPMVTWHSAGSGQSAPKR